MKPDPRIHFRLYVAGDAPHSVQAVRNLNALCREYLPGRHCIEIVDLVREPNRALEDRVLITPLLVKFLPPPFCRVIGNLSDRRKVLQMLELPLPKS